MPKSTLAGHPLHPQLIGAPTALMPMSLILDGMYMTTGKESYADAAYYTMVGGYVGSLAAGAAGALDYFAIPPHTETRKLGNLHAALNVSIVGLYSINLWMRRGKKPPTGPLPVLLNGLGNVGLLISAWYGGEMVYKEGMRVEGVSPVAAASEVKLPGDDKLAEAFGKLGEKAPGGGPQL